MPIMNMVYKYIPLIPSANTLLYLPFNNNYNDESWKWVSVTTNGGTTPTYWAINSNNYLITSNSRIISTLSTFDINNMTFSCWLKKTGSSLCVAAYWWWPNSWTHTDGVWNWLIINSSNKIVLFPYGRDITTTATIQLNAWTNIVIVTGGWTVYVYVDGTLKYSTSKTFTSSSYIARFLANPYVDSTIRDPFVWNIDEVIIENKTWTSTDVKNYYNQAKSKFWL